jgi:hypothetical protein
MGVLDGRRYVRSLNHVVRCRQAQSTIAVTDEEAGAYVRTRGEQVRRAAREPRRRGCARVVNTRSTIRDGLNRIRHMRQRFVVHLYQLGRRRRRFTSSCGYSCDRLAFESDSVSGYHRLITDRRTEVGVDVSEVANCQHDCAGGFGGGCIEPNQSSVRMWTPYDSRMPLPGERNVTNIGGSPFNLFEAVQARNVGAHDVPKSIHAALTCSVDCSQ